MPLQITSEDAKTLKRQKKTYDQTKSIEIMLNEYNALKDFRELIIKQSESRVNLYLTMLTATIAALPLFSFIFVDANNEVDYKLFSLIVFVIATILLYIGFISFLRKIESHISTIKYTKAINIARRFFYDRDKSIRKYLIMPISDNKPVFGTYGFSPKPAKSRHRGATSLLMVLNTINLLFVEVSLFYYLEPNTIVSSNSSFLLCGIALVTAISYYLFLNCIYKKRVREAHDSYKVHIRPPISIYPRKKKNLRIKKLKKETIFKIKKLKDTKKTVLLRFVRKLRKAIDFFC